MNVLVDTSVWSLALRRRTPEPRPPVEELRELICEGRAQIIGPVRQEVLSGIREERHFQRLRLALRSFADLALTRGDFERAAELLNHCRKRGIQGSNTDFLICAVAERLNAAVLTTDLDFSLFIEHISVRIHPPRPDFLEA